MLSMEHGIHTGLFDRDGRGIVIGAVVRMPVTGNTDMHGEWADYTVEQRGMTPVLTYLTSEKGRVLPVGYLAQCLSDQYDQKMFLFATDISKLRPHNGMHVVG